MSDETSFSAPQPQGRSNKLMILLIALLLVVIVLIGVVIVLLTRPKTTVIEPSPSGGRGTVVTEDNAEEIRKQQAEATPVPDTSYVTSMSINWHFKGQTSKDAYVANDVANTRTVYFDMLLFDTKELIYSSPYIPVGAEMNGITLDKELKPGTYETILVYHLVDDAEKELSTVSVALTIYVE